MEQTVNTWNKGLQMDTHPMVLSNDTLSDALNATFVTMNGNEVILLNDMGNRRVDNAFLPPGYLPVGMKEYGGIIYVAAYNPITDKSQIGSFPSPEKKISKMDDENLGGTFDFSSFLSGSNVSTDDYLNLDVIYNDSFMIPLTGDTSLRAGDKFAIYTKGGTGLSSYKDEITNYDNIDGISQDYKAKTPKNKRYTLLVGVLNSQNEFVDITKSLCRWEVHRYDGSDHWSPVTFDQEVSDIYKFNYGYFIADDFTNPQLEETIRDLNLIRERQKIAANTYAYKLIGPLYLKIIFNHIESFNYNIYGIKSGNNTKLWIEAYITYNCPDNSYILWDDLGNEYYTDLETGADFEHGIEDFPVFDFYNSLDMSIPLTPVENGKNTISNISYNQNNNLYSAKITKEYLIEGLTEGIFEYVIGVLADCKTSNVYLKGLSVKNSINLSLLGTGLVNINGWRFYNNLEKETTTLTVSFDAYPAYGRHFGGLYFEFVPLRDSDASMIRYPEEGELPLYNGRQTFNFSWNKRFKSRTLYAVIPRYNVYNNETGNPVTHHILINSNSQNLNNYSISFEEDTSGHAVDNINYFLDLPITDFHLIRWFLTTELFNEFYQPSSGVNDFSTTNNLEFLNKCIINLEATNKVSNDSIKEDDIFEGDLTSKTNTIEYTCRHKYSVNINSSSVIKIIDEELYPEFIFVKPEMKDKILIIGYAIKKIGNNIINDNTSNIYDDIFKSCLSINEGDSITNDLNVNAFKQLDELKILLHPSNKNISGSIEYWDRYKGYSSTGISNVENVFDSLYDLFGKGVIPTEGYFGGIFVNFDSREGHRDGHFIDLYTNLQTYDYLDGNNYPSHSTLLNGGLRAYESWTDSTVELNFKNLKDSIFSYFNLGIFEGLMFLYMTIPRNNNHKYSNSRDVQSGINELNHLPAARVWWRSSDNEWALFSELYAVNGDYGQGANGNSFLAYLRSQFKNDIAYCMYDLYPNEILGIYATDTNRVFYNEFSVPLTLAIDYGILTGVTANSIVGFDKNLPSASGYLGGALSYDIAGNHYNNTTCNLTFTVNSIMPNINPSMVEFNLNSSKIFLENVNKFRVDSIKNVELKRGLRYDIEGKELNRNYMYKYIDTVYKRSDIPKDDSTYQIVGSKDYKNAYGVNDYQGYKIIIWIIKQSIYEADPDFDLNGKYYETRVTEKRAYQLKYYNPRGGATVPDVNDPWKYLNDGVRVPACDEQTVTENRIPRQAPGNGKNLVRIDNNYMKVDSDNKINGIINTVVYNRKDNIGVPQYKFDHCGDDDDDHTILDYTLANIVKLT